MEINISTRQMLKMLYFVAFAIFIGICINSGTYVFNGLYTFVFNSYNASYLGLKSLYSFDSRIYALVMILISVVAILKAVLFYVIVKFLHDNNLNLAFPFNHKLFNFISNLSKLSIIIGVIVYYSVQYLLWIKSKNVILPDIHSLPLNGADVWLLMGVILFVIGQIVKRGIEIQNENELTI